MIIPENLKFSKEHTWLLLNGNMGTVGITDFAQGELGEIVYTYLPNIGKSFSQNEAFGSVEAIKTVSDLFMPVSGIIVEVNAALKDEPTLVNTDPYNGGWLIKISITNPEEISNLLTAAAYQSLTVS
ncbi:glycine cleavage system protein GcvH [Flavihumibacter stibioxidans]|uniref:Glycine cleavage system H protein n=1 Tax=Flavihumibacter stibioxidans TaxID=1834163 RepID=A0ABR7M6P2_9BACT|nr:glycine cleavage system protein GcvH [Flavihumibacter stibioxidans]MBC6490405.1 glycine cleavage system protein H [Flavihumibacter stibioxidans]